MGQLVNVTLNDGTSDLVFKPAGVDSQQVGRLVNSNGVIVGDKTLTISGRTSNSRRKATLKLELPTVVTETVNGIQNPKATRVAYVRLDADFSTLSTTAERNAAIKLIADALTEQLVLDVIVNNEQPY